MLSRNLSQNAIGGSLPPEWGWERSFIQLVTLTLDGNRLSGQLPETYGRPGAWEALQALVVDNNQLTGGCCYDALDTFHNALEGTSTSSFYWEARALFQFWPPAFVILLAARNNRVRHTQHCVATLKILLAGFTRRAAAAGAGPAGR